MMEDNHEEVTGLALIERKLDDFAVRSLVRETCGSGCPLGLARVKGDSPTNIAVLAVVGFKPSKMNVGGVDYVSAYLYDLQNAAVSGRLIAEKVAFTAVIAKPSRGEIEGLLVLILRPVTSIDQATGALNLTVTQQNQLSIVGRCKYFARCGAVKRGNQNNQNGDNSLCKLPIDSSRTKHCIYHSKIHADDEVGSLGNKRSVESVSANPKKILKVSDSQTTLNFAAMMAPRQRVTSTAEWERDGDDGEEEPDKEEVAFNLRHQGAAVLGILGAAYGTSDGSGRVRDGGTDAQRVLKRADATELRVAQRIIDNMAQTSARSGVKSASSGSVTGTGSVLGRPVSALVQRAQLQQIARSANLHPPVSTAHSAAAFALPPSAVAPSTQQQRTTSGAYKLVGDALINAANLYRNAPSAAPAPASSSYPSAPEPSSAPQAHTHAVSGRGAHSNSVDRKAASFHQLLGGAAPSYPSIDGASQQKAAPCQLHASNFASATATSAARRPASVSAPAPGGGGTMSLDAEIDALLGRKSSHAAEADTDWAEGFGKRMDVLAKREYAQTKAAEVHSIEISAFRCGHCENRITEQFPTLCHEQKHPVQKVPVTKRFFECGQCGKRESSLSTRKDLGAKVVLPPEVRCPQCGAFRWHPCGQRGSGPLSLSARDTLAGGGGAAIGTGSGGTNKLILSASEWSKSGDKVSMAERVSRL